MRCVLISLLVVISFLAGCAPESVAPTASTSTTAMPSPGASVLQATARTAPAEDKPAWEIEWEKATEGAKKEREVVALTAFPAYRTELAPLFKRKYGITIEFISGKGSVVAPKILAERRAGIYSYDVYNMGPTTVLFDLNPSGVFDPLGPVLILPEVIDPKGWYGNKLPWTDRDRTTLDSGLIAQPVLAINTNSVKPEQLKSYRDLLDPRWKGRIILNDPFHGGPGSRTLRVIANYFLGWDYLRELKKNEPVVVEDSVQARDWLALGKASVVFGPLTAPFIEGIRAGAPINLYNAQEGSYLTTTGTIGRFNRAPNPNAAKVFINWFLSREGLAVASIASGQQTAREDIPTDFVHPLLLRQPGVKYVYGAGEEFELSQTDEIKKLRDIFAAR